MRCVVVLSGKQKLQHRTQKLRNKEALLLPNLGRVDLAPSSDQQLISHTPVVAKDRRGAPDAVLLILAQEKQSMIGPCLLPLLLCLFGGTAFRPTGRTASRPLLSCRLTPVSRAVMRKMVPRQVSLEQYGSYWGTSQIERVQRVFESVIVAYGGAWLAWFCSFMIGPLLSAVIGVGLIFNWVYTPWLNAKKRNAKIWPKGKNLNYGLYSGRIQSLTKLRRRRGKMIGDVSQEYLRMVVVDEFDRQLEVITQWQEMYSDLRSQMKCECILASPKKDFSVLLTITEVWVPSCDCWVGDYPYLNRDAFESLVCNLEKQTLMKDSSSLGSPFRLDERVERSNGSSNSTKK